LNKQTFLNHFYGDQLLSQENNKIQRWNGTLEPFVTLCSRNARPILYSLFRH
jgi:hypothetical protein